MEAKELRIGNLLYLDTDYVVELKNVDNMIVDIKHKGLDGQANFMRLKPIPINEEWLVKGGCEKVNNSTYRKGTFTFQAVTTSENYQKEDIIDRIFNSKKGFRVCMQSKFVRNIFCVHDWQNFHFGISKQELIFNNE